MGFHEGPNQPASLDGSNSVIASYSYDQYGDRTNIQNGRGFTTVFTYDSNNLYVAQKVHASGTPDARTFSYVNDFNSGLVTTETDVDHNIVRTFDYDKFGRNTLISESGGGITRNKGTTYNDGIRQIIVRSDLNAANDGLLVSATWYDQLGRVRLTKQMEGPGDVNSDALGIKVQMRYFTPAGSNSYQLASNPYVGTGEATMGWTRTKFDRNGRTLEVQHFSGADLPAPWGTNASSTGAAATSYSSNATTVSDEAGVTRTNYTDGLGRLIHVTENGISTDTSYAYDALDNLVRVTQPSGSARTFAHSSLKLLTGTSNPESGAASYTYDGNGNVLTRTLGGITTTYTYSGLDLIKTKTYSDSGATPWVTYTYDKDRLLSVSADTVYQRTVFDGLGRVTDASQSTGGHTYSFHYTYNLADSTTSVTLPSGRVITTAYDGAGRPSAVTGTLAGVNTTYASSASYAPQGAARQINLGNTLIEQRCYNARLQPVLLRQRTGGAADCATGANPDANDLLHLRYDYGSGSNNGNVLAQTITAQTPQGTKVFQQNYGYDGVSRLQTASETGPGTAWSQTYGYDAVGNRWVSAGLTLSPFTPQGSGLFDPNTNRMTGSGAQYDAAGNQTQIGGYSFQYDAENRLKSSTINSATTLYTYDGEGRRVTKQAPDGTLTTFVYDLQGRLAAEYSSQAPTGYAETRYLMADHLGSTRMMTSASAQVLALHDYLPFGEEMPSGLDGRTSLWGGPDPKQKFTGKEHDDESGLDFFGARYLSGSQGRFTSPDPVHFQAEMLGDPQRLNLYAYTRNNPLRFVDPKGEAIELLGDEDERRKALEALQQGVRDRAGIYLYENKIETTDASGKKTTKYYVGIQSNANEPFEKTNPGAASIAAIIRSQEVVTFGLVSSGTTLVNDLGEGVTIGPNASYTTPGVTGRFGGRVGVFILNPSTDPGQVPVQKMRPDRAPGTIDQGILALHEFGHAGYLIGVLEPGPSNKAAVDLENMARRNRDPNAPLRRVH